MSPRLLVLAFAALVVAGQARLNAVVLGRPVSIPALGIAAAVVVLALTAVVLWLLRAAFRDGGFLRLRPRVAET